MRTNLKYPRLLQLISDSGISQTEIAGNLGLNIDGFQEKLAGKRTITLDEAVQLRSLLQTELSVEELFSRE